MEDSAQGQAFAYAPPLAVHAWLLSGPETCPTPWEEAFASSPEDGEVRQRMRRSKALFQPFSVPLGKKEG